MGVFKKNRPFHGNIYLNFSVRKFKEYFKFMGCLFTFEKKNILVIHDPTKN